MIVRIFSLLALVVSQVFILKKYKAKCEILPRLLGTVGEENETFFRRVWKPLKTLRGSQEEKALELLQMVLEPARTLDPKGVDCEIPHQLERGTRDSEEVEPQRGMNYEIPH